MVLPPGVRPAAPSLQEAGVPCSGDTEGIQAGATPLYPAQTTGGSCQDSLSTGPRSGAGAIVGFILSLHEVLLSQDGPLLCTGIKRCRAALMSGHPCHCGQTVPPGNLRFLI